VQVHETRAGAVLEATLEWITYANTETGYTVARVDTGRGGDLGHRDRVAAGRPAGDPAAAGRWGSHPQNGRQFQVEDYTTVLPATVQGIRRYLGPGRIKGIAPQLAERIADHFGLEALRVIDEQPGGWSRCPAWIPSGPA
jgi:exodeoxyribonuclease V alpha subunit